MSLAAVLPFLCQHNQWIGKERGPGPVSFQNGPPPTVSPHRLAPLLTCPRRYDITSLVSRCLLEPGRLPLPLHGKEMPCAAYGSPSWGC